MTPLLQIRTNVFGVSQSEMAEIAAVTQATISRWETGHHEPDRDALARIRDEAHKRRLPWDDSWFFDPPSSELPEAAHG